MTRMRFPTAMAGMLATFVGATSLAGTPPGNFLCQEIRALGSELPERVSISDAFDTGGATVVNLHHVCLPASFEGDPIVNAGEAFATYRTDDFQPPHTSLHVETSDLIRDLQLDTIRPDLLIVPAGVGGRPAPDRDAYQCYRLIYPAFENPWDVLGNEFIDPPRLYKIRKPRLLCLPASVNGSPVASEPYDMLTCYRFVPRQGQVRPPRVPDVAVTTAFETVTGEVGKPDIFCTPAALQ